MALEESLEWKLGYENQQIEVIVIFLKRVGQFQNEGLGLAPFNKIIPLFHPASSPISR